MQEMIMEGTKSLLEIPKGEKMFGIVLPTAECLTVDGLADVKSFDTYTASKLFHINRIIAEYHRNYGARVFYCGTFTNPSGGVYRLFSFPIRYRVGDKTDMTIVGRSCEQLEGMVKKFPVDVTLLPLLGNDLGITSFANCVKPVLSLLFDDSFIMVHRKDLENV